MAFIFSVNTAAAQAITKDTGSASVPGTKLVAKASGSVKAKSASKKPKAGKKLKSKRARAKLPPAKTLRAASSNTAVASVTAYAPAPSPSIQAQAKAPAPVSTTRNPYLPGDAPSNTPFLAPVAPVRLAQVNPYLAYRHMPVADVAPGVSSAIPGPSANPYLAKPVPAPIATQPAPTPWDLLSRLGQAEPLQKPAETPAAYAMPESTTARTAGYPNPVNPYLAGPTSASTSSQPGGSRVSTPIPVTQAVPKSSAPYVSNPVAAPLDPVDSLSGLFNSIRMEIPLLNDQAILPVIKTVYPTGEKPLKVLTFKCPTELVGISPPPTKALRGLIDLGMEAFNKADILPFDMQQVCQ